MVRFGIRIVQSLAEFNAKHGLDVHIRIGIDSGLLVPSLLRHSEEWGWKFSLVIHNPPFQTHIGNLITACLGKARSFEIFGQTYTTATALEAAGEPDHVSRGGSRFLFRECGLLEVETTHLLSWCAPVWWCLSQVHMSARTYEMVKHMFPDANQIVSPTGQTSYLLYAGHEMVDAED